MLKCQFEKKKNLYKIAIEKKFFMENETNTFLLLFLHLQRKNEFQTVRKGRNFLIKLYYICGNK